MAMKLSLVKFLGLACILSSSNGGGIEKYKNQAVKVGKHKYMSNIEREVSILKRLRDAEGTCEHLPRHVESDLLDNEGLRLEMLRGHTATLPALIMSPCGIPILHAFLHGEVKLLSIVHQIFSALSYSHRNGVYHLDVNPWNIIYDGEKVILIGFSISSSDCNEDRKGFRGTVNYAHRDIFEYHPAKSWPKEEAKYEEFDAAGLYFTAAVLQNNGDLPWSRIRDFSDMLQEDKNTFNDLMSDRQRKAAKLVDDLFDPENKKTKIDASFPFAKRKTF